MNTPTFETLDLRLQDNLAHLSLNRPEAANALSATLWQELGACFQWLDEAASVRVVVLQGEGKHFCAGIDLAMLADLAKEFVGMEEARRAEALRRRILTLQDHLNAVERCRKPVLAAVHGACPGAGLALAACCDMRYCTVDARFSIRETALGMTADVGTLQRLPGLVPAGWVREWAYTGRDIEAGEAREAGLVNRVFDNRAALQQGVDAIAREIAGNAPLAVRGTKQNLLYSRDHTVHEGLDYVAGWNAGMLSFGDVTAAIEARASGKSPNFED